MLLILSTVSFLKDLSLVKIYCYRSCKYATYRKVFQLNKPQAQSRKLNTGPFLLMKVYEESGYARESYILDKLTDHLKKKL